MDLPGIDRVLVHGNNRNGIGAIRLEEVLLLAIGVTHGEVFS